MSQDLLRRTRVGVVLTLAVWLGAVLIASSRGWLGSVSPYLIPVVAGVLALLPAAAFWLLPSFHAVIVQFGLRRLTALHIFRIAAVPLFFWYGAHGLLPRSFVNHAGWGDLLSGLLALLVVLLWMRPSGLWLMHIVGMLDFVYAFATAMSATRGDFNAMHAVTQLPAALIPFFGVGVLASTHLMAFTLLLQREAVGEYPVGRLGAREFRRKRAPVEHALRVSGNKAEGAE